MQTEAATTNPCLDDDVQRIKREIPHLEKDTERVYMALLVYTGMRPEEIRRI